jgi:T5SS/PEP-CTERM-associated repeat protein
MHAFKGSNPITRIHGGSRRMNIPRFVLIVSALALGTNALSQTVWTDGTGDWFNSANWSMGVPTFPTAAQINNGGTAQITSSGASAGDVTLGLGSLDSGTLSTSGSGNATTGSLYIGESGKGTFSIINGGVVSSIGFVIGDNSSSSGVTTVSGAGSTWTNIATCFVGFLGTAKLNITSGGNVSDSQASIGESTGSNGMVTVDGAGSTWTHFTSVTVGGDGTGRLNITNGGTVSCLDPDFGLGVIGRNPGSNGIASVSGAGSAWIMNASLSIADGFAGTTGTLHIMNGGAVSNSYAILGGFGGSGTASVDGLGSTWTNSGNLFLGANGGAGVLSVSHGGHVSSSIGYVGLSNGFGGTSSTGTVNIDGAGSTWTSSGNVYVGGSESGPGGTGLLRVTNGGVVSTSNVIIWNTGTLGGTGTIQGNVTNNGGIVSPGDSSGTLRVTADYTQQASGTLLIDIAGHSSGQFSVLNVLGNASLNGTLDPVLLNGFIPMIGQSFVFLDYASLAGAFSGIENQVFDNGMEKWSVAYQSTDAILTAESTTSSVADQASTFLLLTLSLLGLATCRQKCWQ